MAHIGQVHFTGALYCFFDFSTWDDLGPLQSFAARTLQSPFCVQGLQRCTSTFYALRLDGPWGLGARHRNVPYKEKKDQIGPNLVTKWHQTWEYRGVWSTFDVQKKCSRRLFGREFVRRPRTTAWRCLRLKDAKNMPRSTVPASLVTRTVSDAVPHIQFKKEDFEKVFPSKWSIGAQFCLRNKEFFSTSNSPHLMAPRSSH